MVFLSGHNLLTFLFFLIVPIDYFFFSFHLSCYSRIYPSWGGPLDRSGKPRGLPPDAQAAVRGPPVLLHTLLLAIHKRWRLLESCRHPAGLDRASVPLSQRGGEPCAQAPRGSRSSSWHPWSLQWDPAPRSLAAPKITLEILHQPRVCARCCHHSVPQPPDPLPRRPSAPLSHVAETLRSIL